MPRTTVIFFKESNGKAPVLEWLDKLMKSDSKGWANCRAKIGRLAESGFELRRSEADILRDGIHELRAKHRRVQYRILYFFHGRNVAVLAHSILKPGSAVPPIEIERALLRKGLFEKDPAGRTYFESEDR